jgi:tripartite-type tricarboxylate transporter receptor subunit TctC
MCPTYRNLVVVAAIAGCMSAVQAQDYPNRTVRIIVPVLAGGSPDVLGRMIAERLRERYGQPFIIDNRAGAGQMIGAELAAKAAPDGYTLLLPTATFASSVATQPKLAFDPINDLTGLAMIGVGPFMIAVHPSFPVKSMKEIIAMAKAKPAEINYGTAGAGSIVHLATEVMSAMSGIKLTSVPYKSAAPAVTAAVSGEVPMIMMSLPSVWTQVRNNRLRAIAVTTAQRSSFAPELPTVAESGVPGYEATQWWGMFAPARVPKEHIARINGEINRILSIEEMRARLAHEGAEPMLRTPEAFTTFVHAEIAKFRKVVKERNIRPE